MPSTDIAEVVQKACKAEPFKPFAVSLKDGRTFEIDQPGKIWIAMRSHLCVITLDPDSYVFVDTSYLGSVNLKAA